MLFFFHSGAAVIRWIEIIAVCTVQLRAIFRATERRVHAAGTARLIISYRYSASSVARSVGYSGWLTDCWSIALLFVAGRRSHQYCILFSPPSLRPSPPSSHPSVCPSFSLSLCVCVRVCVFFTSRRRSSTNCLTRRLYNAFGRSCIYRFSFSPSTSLCVLPPQNHTPH